MLIIYIRNPDDGTTTYNKIKIYRSNSYSGTYTNISTIDIDTTTRTDQSPGFTLYTDNTGTTDNWYKISFYNSTNSTETNLSDPFQGGTSELDNKIRRRIKDTNPNSYFFTNDEIAEARDLAIQSLYPSTWIEDVYEVDITEQNKKEIVLPYYVFRIDKILIYDSSNNLVNSNFISYYKVGNKIYPSIGDFSVGYKFRFIISKPYTIAAECPPYFDDYLVTYAQLVLLRILEMDRNRYYKYTSVIRPEGGNLPSIGRIIERLEIQLARRRNELRRFREASDINLV